MNKTAQRQQALMHKLMATDGAVNVDALSESLGVSAATVRRDLNRLSDDGLITRTYGGAVISANHPEKDLSERAMTHATQKREIAAFAATLVSPGMTVILDAGSTTSLLASILARTPQLTVFCNGVEPLRALVSADTDTTIVALGGVVGRRNHAMSGPLAEYALTNVVADVAFIGADCVHSSLGFSTRSLEQAHLKTVMAQRSRRPVLLADHSKIEADWGTFWAPVPTPCELITDDRVSTGALEALSTVPGLSVLRAPAPPLTDRTPTRS